MEKAMTDTKQVPCTGCGEDDIAEFHSNSRGGLKSQCKECLKQKRKPYPISTHPSQSRSFEVNPKAARNLRDWKLRDKYGITLEQYEEMLLRQDGVCAICKATCSTGRALAVDHCHANGRIRELLCNACNRAIGAFHDDPKIAAAALHYLQKHTNGE